MIQSRNGSFIVTVAVYNKFKNGENAPRHNKGCKD